jgi:hypothetical protein
MFCMTSERCSCYFAPFLPLEAFLSLVRHRTAILACALTKLLHGGSRCDISVVLLAEFVGRAVVCGSMLVAEGGCACVQVPWCL